MLQSTIHKKDTIDLSSAPWTMHEFFAGSGLVAYGLKGMFATVWANDISEQKAAVYEANLGNDHFKLGDIKDVKGTELPFAHLSWALWVAFTQQEAVWYGNGFEYWMR